MAHPPMPGNQPFAPLIYPHDLNQRQAGPDGADRSAMYSSFARSPSHNMPMQPNFFAPPPPPMPNAAPPQPMGMAQPPQPMPPMRNQGPPQPPPPQSGMHPMQHQHAVHHGPMMYPPPYVPAGPHAAPMSARQRHPLNFNPLQLRYLISAYNVGMLAMDTLARRVHDDRPQAKYARNPP